MAPAADVDMAPAADVDMAPTAAGMARPTWASRAKFLVAASIVFDFLMTGITYGYSGIVPVLTLDTKAFASTCRLGEALPCDGQIQALTAAFTLSVSTVSASGIPVGLLLDAVGPRHTTILGSLVFALGLICFAAAPLLSDLLYYAGFFLLSFGGPAIITATMNFAELFPALGSAIISAQNGAFDASSAVMFLMGKASSAFGLSLGSVMLYYAVVPAALILIAALTFPDLPCGSEPEAAPESDTESTPSSSTPQSAPPSASAPGPLQQSGELWRLYYIRLNSVKHRGPRLLSAEEATAGSDVAPACGAPAMVSEPGEATGSSGPSGLLEPLLPVSVVPKVEARSLPSLGGGAGAEQSPSVALPPDIYNSDITAQIKSTVFWVLVLVSSYLVTRSNFYIASIYQQLLFTVLEQNGQDLAAAQEVASLYLDVFNYIMPIGGALSVFLSGWFMVRLGMSATFAFIGAMCVTVSSIQVLAVALPIEAQVAGFVVFAVLRAFIFGAIAAFLGVIFGFRNFGRLFGISRVAGAVITIVQYPLIHLAETTFSGDYRPVDVGFLVLEALLMVGFPLYLWKGVFYGYFFTPHRSSTPKENGNQEPVS